MSVIRNGEPRRGLLIGAGYFSQFHLDAWARMENAEIVAICDLDEGKARQAATKYGIEHVTTRITEALRRDDLDFVDIATAPAGRKEIVSQVVERGLPMICQKPMANDYRSSQDIIHLAHDASIPLMVHENFRFQPWYREIRRLLDSGVIGRKLHSISMQTRLGDGWGDDAYLSRQPYFRTMPRLLVHETGVHFVDVFRYLAGEIDACSAKLRRLNSDIVGEDTGLLQFEFANGAIGTWDANRYNEPLHDNPRYTFGKMLVEANEGSIYLDWDGSLTIKRLGEPAFRSNYVPSKLGFGGDCVFACQRHFIQFLDGEVACETAGIEYLMSLRVVEALYESSRRNQTVRLKPSTRGGRHVVDLSLPFSEKIPKVFIEPCKSIANDGWNATTITTYSHAGTHMDAPKHFLPEGRSLDQQDLSACCGPARVVNLTPCLPKQLHTIEDVTSQLGVVYPGDRLLLRTDWHKRFGTPEYRNELPRISRELAEWLVDQQVALVGVEPPSVADVNNMAELTEIHHILFRGEVVIVEGLANLDQLSQPEVEFIALPLNVVGGDGCPVRAIAIEGGIGS